MIEIELTQLRAHPLNSNVMPDDLLDKLAAQIQPTGMYPALIVRPSRVARPESRVEDGHRTQDAGRETFQVLDGHHRWKALARLGHLTARCEVWDVDDAAALMFLATLNRLRGEDDPRRRASLLDQLATATGRGIAE